MASESNKCLVRGAMLVNGAIYTFYYMSSNKSYSEKLKDFRWKDKRIEILERDEYSCQICGFESKSNHIHHTYYDKDIEPWEYENNSLITLCQGCHEDEENMKSLEITSYKYAMGLGLLRTEVAQIIVLLSQIQEKQQDRELIKEIISSAINYLRKINENGRK